MKNLWFSRAMGPEEEREIKVAKQALMEILEAPHAAKENLMKTNYKVASSILGFHGRVLQAESATMMAYILVADRASKSPDFSKTLKANLPSLELPEECEAKSR